MRLDKYLSDGSFSSRSKAARAIERGLVLLNGRKAKPSDDVKETDSVVILDAEESYVSEGGYKWAKAVREFQVEIRGKVWIDIGASTGGFTDVLLKNGAEYVYAVDVGRSQLDPRIASDERVCIMDEINARNLSVFDFARRPDGVVTDVSFISLTYILPVVADLLEKNGEVLALIKPQFECGAQALDKHGIVKDCALRRLAIDKIFDCAFSCGLAPVNIIVAPVRARKNVEFIIYLKKGAVARNKEEIVMVEQEEQEEQGAR